MLLAITGAILVSTVPKTAEKGRTVLKKVEKVGYPTLVYSLPVFLESGSG